jgi:hypothetical protein
LISRNEKIGPSSSESESATRYVGPRKLLPRSDCRSIGNERSVSCASQVRRNEQTRTNGPESNETAAGINYLELFPRVDGRAIGHEWRPRAEVLIRRHEKTIGRRAYPDRLAHRRGGLRGNSQ